MKSLIVLLILMILIPSYFLYMSIKNKEERKKNISLFILTALPILVIGMQEMGYRLFQSQLTKESYALFESVYHIPKSEILVIEPMDSRIKKGMNLEITTKKDFAFWQKQVKQNNRLLNGEDIPAEQVDKVIQDIKNCEITYSSGYGFKQLRPYTFPLTNIEYRQEDGVSVGISTGKNNLPEVIKLSKREEESKKRLEAYFAFPISDKEVKELMAYAKDAGYPMDD
ncbi:hypothetical protein DOK76_00875 [Vagococcus sp. DIV0080]|uniref:Uncharacterized protein n=1 Tax=Candidatus Vagococcus giribetii TaxID=2230876 RepID=A0ABS3HPE1_9ENTE|nr:hypothetical protein [Vagococcus sp. DIV0080]MBO0475600.1 hypothetical protein [Vagococcus sp. DIV0080]